jgi:DNA-binding transcriptional regulator YdaS (Cro superfamily)
MKLATWIKTHYRYKRAFALKIGITEEHLSRILSGARFPSRKLAQLIEEITGGEIDAHNLLIPKKRKS